QQYGLSANFEPDQVMIPLTGVTLRSAWIREPGVVVGTTTRGDKAGPARDLRGLRGAGRVWVLLSHTWDEQDRYLNALDAIGIRLDHFQGAGAAVFLYDTGPSSTGPMSRS